MTNEALDKAIDILSVTGVARACGRQYQAVQKWQAKGRLPRTEWTGETHYADAIERATDGAVTKAQLLELPAQPSPEPNGKAA